MSYETLKNHLRSLKIKPLPDTLSMTSKYIDQVEKVINTTLPEAYKNILSEFSMSFIPVSYSIIEVKYENCLDETMEVMYGAATESAYCLLLNIRGYRDRMPATVIPIGDDAFGNQTCLGISGDVRNKVYFWDHELEVTEGEPDFSNMQLVANSFEDFVMSMKFVEGYEEDDE